MKLSSRSRHAVSVMLELAQRDTRSETPIIDMAKKCNLSQSSMEQLFARLRKSGLVAGRRGRRGGYRLARNADAISVAEIIAAVDDDSLAVRNGITIKATVGQPDKANMVWDCLSGKLYQSMGQITLADAIEMGQGRDEVADFSLENSF